MSEVNQSYDVASIEIYKGLDGIRKRPSMYLGDLGDPMVFQMLKEIVDNAVDEYMAGRNSYISITVCNNGTLIVYDQGHGIPTGRHSQEDINTLTAVFSMVHAGGKFNNKAYASSAGTFGTGAAAVNAVSKTFRVWTTWRNNWHHQAYQASRPTTDVVVKPPPKFVRDLIAGFKNTGTLILFEPDQSVVALNPQQPAKLPVQKTLDYLKTLSYLNPKLTLVLQTAVIDSTTKTSRLVKKFKFHTENGMADLLASRITDPISRVFNGTFSFSSDDHNLQVALAWTDYDQDDGLWAYVNSSRTVDGGKHVDGLFSAYMKAITQHVTLTKPKDDAGKTKATVKLKSKSKKTKAANKTGKAKVAFDKLTLRDFKVGLMGVMNLRMSGAQYSSQTKERLSSDVSKSVETQLLPALLQFFKSNPSLIKSIVARAGAVADGRDNFRQVMKSLSAIKQTGALFLPNVLLAAPEAKPQDRELYICEGMSALGGCKKARNASFQEVLALSGKITNASRNQLGKVLSSETIQNLILSMGANSNELADRLVSSLSTDKLRVNKLFILADQDPDGSHISVLALTLIWSIFRDLFLQGRVWVVNAKLYHAEYKNQFYFGDTLEDCLSTMPPGAPKGVIVRAKGLAEYSPSVLRHIAFDQNTRFVLKICPPLDKDAQKYFESLVGPDTATRKALLSL